jgi:MtfA peptidase
MLMNWWRRRRRARILDEPFPREWFGVLERNVGHYARLSDPERVRVRQITQVMIAEKRWESAGGFLMTDEAKVTIAGQAALLLLGMDHDYYSRVPSVIVYPRPYAVPDRDEFGDEDDTFPAHVVEGQAVYRGPVLFSWEEVLREGRDPTAGHNVVVHEFAHQLDFLDNSIDGTPNLPDAESAAKWGRVMQAAFDRHCRAIKTHSETFFTEHAAENETEFFADASEAFFCVPQSLAAEEPDVFGLLVGYYRIDPRRWFESEELLPRS